ncbi:MAG: hypothetical protein NZ988_02435 [Thaumarchaeota archaeon]|nr:hypothetical protein [Candidatus Calditenuaceae archaeon]MDW8186893.1 hypothetical protein [Nitrososphaerota archaeon]
MLGRILAVLRRRRTIEPTSEVYEQVLRGLADFRSTDPRLVELRRLRERLSSLKDGRR